MSVSGSGHHCTMAACVVACSENLQSAVIPIEIVFGDASTDHV